MKRETAREGKMGKTVREYGKLSAKQRAKYGKEERYRG
jgi:hypothetical protein